MASKPTLNEPASTYTAGEDQGVIQEKAAEAVAEFKAYYDTVDSMFTGFKDQITGYNAAFYGDSSGNVKKYVDGVIDKCQELMKTLSEFEPKIQASMASYKAQQETIYSAIGNNSFTDGNGSNNTTG